MKEYKVGQILFVISEKTTKIIPVQIVEEVVRTTIEGKEKTYTIMLPDKEATKVDIKSIKGELFTTWQSLRAKMVNNATKAIDSMVSSAIDISQEVFDVDISKQEPVKKSKLEVIIPETVEQNVQLNKEEDIIRVDLGNGMVGNMSVDSLEKMRN